MAITKAIAASSNGVNQIVAGVANYKFRVLAFVLSFSGNVNAKWQSNPGSNPTDLTGLMYGAAGVVVSSPTIPQARSSVTPAGQFVTNPGDDLSLNLSTNVAVGGSVTYEQIPQGM